MKSLILGLLLILSSLVVAQSQFRTSTGSNSIYYNWQLTNTGCYPATDQDYFTCASFYWCVTRSNETDADGYYYFNIWFYSNSYVWASNQQYWMSTYVWGINLYVDGYLFNKAPVWFVFKENYAPLTLRFKTLNASPVILMSWQGKKIS